jgi:hypothetical protein
VVRTVRRLLLALAALGSAPAQASPLALGGSTLDVPASFAEWTRKDAPDGVLLQRLIEPKDARGRKGFAIVLLGAPKTVVASFEQDFAAFTRSLRQVPAEKAFTVQDGLTSDGHRIHLEQRCCRSTEGMKMNVWHVGVATAGHEQFLMLLAMGLERDTEDPIRDAFQALVRSLRPDPADHGFVLTPASGGALDGLYTRTTTSLTPNVFGGLNFTANQDTLLFDPGGLYATEVPHDGDLTAECRTVPQLCGTYAVRTGGFFGGAPHLERTIVENAFGMVRHADDPLVQTGDTLTIGTLGYRRVQPFAPGQHLAGTWTNTWGTSGPTGSVGGARTLTLTADGRFTREGFTSFATGQGSSNTGASVVGNATRPSQTGRYELGGYRLTLTGDDGRVDTLSLFAPDPGSRGLLVIGGANYLAQGK